MKKTDVFRIGLWTIVAIIVLIFGIKYLKGKLHSSDIYYIECQNVDGLAESSHVKINGYKIGLVREMDFNPQHGGNVVVELGIESKYKIPKGSTASIEPDLLGSSNVVISLSGSSEVMSSGDTIEFVGMRQGLMDGVGNVLPAVQNLLPKVDSILTGLNGIVNETKLQESLLQVNGIVQQLKMTLSNLNVQMPEILEHVDNATSNLDSLSANLRNVDIQSITKQVESVLESANSLLSTINGSEGTAARLINTDELHNQLEQTLAGVDSLVSDIKQNPKRYINIKVFGK